LCEALLDGSYEIWNNWRTCPIYAEKVKNRTLGGSLEPKAFTKESIID